MMNNRFRSRGGLVAVAVLLAALAGALLLWGGGAHVAVTAVRANAGILYVDASASSPAPDGLSWTTAFTELQSALAVAMSGDQIWVAAGVYKPDFDPGSGAYSGYVTATFMLTDGVQLYGGFSSGMISLTQRLSEVHLAVLSGDLESDDQTDARHLITDTTYISGTNVLHVVTAIGVDDTAVLDGFFVTGGQAIDIAPHNVGGGMRVAEASPRIANVTFIGNWANSGGGMRIDNANPALVNVAFINNWAVSGGGVASHNGSNPTLSHVVFDGNQASGGGGGMMNRDGSTPTLSDVVFSGNRANFGGGMVNWDCSPLLTNVLFHSNVSTSVGGGIENIRGNPTLVNVVLSGNYAEINGGGMENNQSSPHLVNVTINGNAALESGGGVYNEIGSAPAIQNSILWGNRDNTGTGTASAQIRNVDSTPVISYTLVQASGGSAAWNSGVGVDGGGNLDADPQFIAPVNPTAAPTTGGNLRLPFGSPAMDAGDNAAVLSPVDLDGKPRVVAPAVDMGAYEIEGVCYATIHAADTVLFVFNSTTGIAVQQAVNAASAGQTVKVAGDCIGGVTTQQTVYITKSLTLRGGYDPADWTVSLPFTHPTTLDAAGEGRVVYVVGPANVVLENLRLVNGALGSENSRGGGVRADSASVLISGCEIVSNTATYGAGVAFTGGSSGRIVNTLLARNSAGSGAALWSNASGEINMVHTTIAAPSVLPGSAVYATGGTTNLTNVIIANYATGIVQDGTATVTEDYTLFSGVTERESGTVGGGTHSLPGDPRFVSPPHDDYRLQEDSAAIDKGVNAGVRVDFQGDPRPIGTGFDIGYDEFTEPTYFTIFLPLVLRD